MRGRWLVWLTHMMRATPIWTGTMDQDASLTTSKGVCLIKNNASRHGGWKWTTLGKWVYIGNIKRSEVPAGAKVITTKWADTNKGTEREPNYRSRLVGREIKTDDRPDLFAATPPLESLRYVLSLCASTQEFAETP